MKTAHLIEHAATDCDDPDCEVHCPWMIENEGERDTAVAWYIAGMRRACALRDALVAQIAERGEYAYRHKDIVADRICHDGRGGIEVYGRDLDGGTVWVWIHGTETAEEVRPYEEGADDER